jgi:hypothetical protein
MKNKRAVRDRSEWLEYNAQQDARLYRWGTNASKEVKVVHFIKYGHVRWEAQLGVHSTTNTIRVYYPHLIWYYPNKSEAIAKGVELVLKGYAVRVIDE